MSALTRLIKSIALKHGKCINTVEPAAVLVFPTKIKVAAEIRPESTAAGHFEVKCKNKAKQKKEVKKWGDQGFKVKPPAIASVLMPVSATITYSQTGIVSI